MSSNKPLQNVYVPAIPFPEERVAQLESLIEKYAARIVPRSLPRTSSNTSHKVVVLVTGTTGALGSYLIQFLINDPRVHHVYTLNRPASTRLDERQASTFRELSLDASVLSSSKLTSLEGNLPDEYFGLNPKIYEKLLNSVTIVIHNAWALNFKSPVSTFEPLIAGSVNLLNFAHALRISKARFVFCSSVIAMQNYGCVGSVPNDVIQNAQVALGCGYGESKYVAERLVALSQVSACSIRIPQLYLDGTWHAASDWLPFVVKFSLALGQAPASFCQVDWIPMDFTAKFLVDVACHSAELPKAINIRHPDPVSFLHVLSWLQGALASQKGEPLSMSISSFSSWVENIQNLRKAWTSPKKMPAFGLLKFLENLQEREERMESVPMVGAYPALDISAARSVSPLLIAQLKPLEQKVVSGWVDHWIKADVLPLARL
ncbi:hypothetical protein ONZ45_g13886 [Pleurotus djamor]|nr:hypothetical protein ONZ45_g13886 [Pleurotus djamor]